LPAMRLRPRNRHDTSLPTNLPQLDQHWLGTEN
jgi:hypothetical protein